MALEHLNDVYDGEDPPLAPVKAAKALPTINQGRPSWAGGGVTPINPSDYTGYTNAPVYIDKLNTLETERGEGQSALDKWVNFVPRIAGKILTNFVEGVSYIPELFTSGSDYSNAGTESMKEANAWLDKNFPIYRRTEGFFGPSVGSTISDLGWWLQNGEGAITSIASFALEGYGFAKLLGSLGKIGKIGAGIEGTIGAISDAKTAARIIRGGQETLTAGLMAYTEGAMSGKKVYDEVYAAQMQKLIAAEKDPEEAHNIARMKAAESASTTVQLNTIINTGMNLLGGVSQFFNHEKSYVIDAAKKYLFAKEGESTAQWLKRLATEDGNKYARELTGYIQGEGKKKLLMAGLKRGKEAFAEGTEELTNQFAERTGIEEGREGRTYNMLTQFGQLSKYLDRTMDQEGALNFLMGAVVGPVQQALTHNIPYHKVETGVRTVNGQMVNTKGEVVDKAEDAAKEYAKGLFGMNRVSAFQSRTEHGIKFFNDIRDKVKADAMNIVSIETRMKEAIANDKPLEAERLQRDYFNLMNKNSVALGFAENLKETYRETANLDNTKSKKDEVTAEIEQLNQAIEAGKTNGEDTTQMQQQLADAQVRLGKASDKTAAQLLGFTNSKDNNEYKTKAQNAIQTLEELQKIHDTVQKKYGPEEVSTNLSQAHVADFIFDHTANLHLMKKQRAEYQGILDEMDTPVEGIDNEYQAQVTAEKRYHQRTSALIYQLDKIEQDIETLQNHANSPSTAGSKVLSRHGVLNATPSMEREATQDLISKLNIKRTQIGEELKDQENQSLTTEGYRAFLDAGGKTYREYTEQLKKNYEHNAKQKAYATAIGELDTEIETHEQYLADLEKAPTLDKILKNTENYFEQLEKTRKERQGKWQKERKERKDNEVKLAQQRLKRLKALRERYQQEFEELNRQIAQKEEQLKKLIHDLRYFRRRPTRETVEQTAQRWEDLKRAKDALFNELEEIDYKRQQILQSIQDVDSKMEEANGKPTQDKTPVIDEDQIDQNQKDGKDTQESDTESSTTSGSDQGQEEKISVTEDDSKDEVSIAAQEYYALVDSLSKEGKESVESTRMAILNGEQPFSLNALSFDEAAGIIPEQMGPVLMSAMRKFLEEQGAEIREVSDLREVIESDTTKIPPAPEVPDTEGEQQNLPIENDGFVQEAPSNDILLRDDREFKGDKQISPHDSLAQRSMEFGQAVNADGDYVKVGRNVLNSNLNTAIVTPWGVPPGTDLVFEVDTTYKGTVVDWEQEITPEAKDNQKEEDTQDYFEGEEDNKKIKLDPTSVGNFPVKVSTSDGKLLGYLHRNQWIEATRPDTSGPERFANTADEIDGKPGNVDRQIQLSLAQRYSIALAFNRGTTVLTGNVTEKKAGRLLSLKGYDKAMRHLGHQRKDGTWTGHITLGVVISGQIHGTNTKETMSPEYHNHTVAMIPRADGSYTPTILKGTPLADTDALEVMTRLTELLLAPNTEKNRAEITLIKKHTGFDVSTVEGYRGYIIQHYTHFSKFSSLLNTERVKSIIDTDDRGVPRISIRTQTRNAEVKAYVDENGKVNPEFKKALLELFTGRYKAVALTKPGFKGVNDSSEFNYMGYKNGEWAVNPRHDGKPTKYNDYILPFLYTNLTYAKGVNPNGSTPVTSPTGQRTAIFVYDVNPIIKFKIALPADVEIVPETVTMEASTSENKYGGSVAEGLDVLQELGLDMSMRPTVQSVGTQEKAPVSLESLQELYHQTPLNQRNGKLPQQVLEEMKLLNITHPSFGYNPFKICG